MGEKRNLSSMVAALNSGCIHGCSWAARSDSLFLLQWDIPAVESFQLEGSGRESASCAPALTRG